MLQQIRKDLKKFSSKERARVSQRFFKTGKGEYGEGDKFIGISVPDTRKIAKKYKDIPLTILKQLLTSPLHEERLLSLFILVDQFSKGDEGQKKKVYNFYLKNTKHVNNWDLVDSSAHKILGPYVRERDRRILYKFVKSKNLWERRIAIITTYHSIKQHQFTDTLKISKLLLHDKHDLIHKAVGWMLREVGKQNQRLLEQFLDQHAKEMPRTMLRYAIERFPEKLRRHYMK